MNTHDLEAFLAVVETGSIVAASARLNLTQPGVTRRIQNLEDLLGTQLLDRQSKPFKPTRAGQEAYEYGRRVLRALDDLKAGATTIGGIGGEFRLGITPYLSEAALAGPVDRLRRDFPDLALRVTSAWSPQLMEQVSRSALDAAALCLIDGVAPPAELAADDLGTSPVLLVASPDLGVPDEASLNDLCRFPWVMNQDGCGFRAALRRRFEEERLPFTVGVEAQNPDLRLSLVARGLGIALTTAASLQVSPFREAVRTITLIDFSPRIRAWLVHRPPVGRLAQPLSVFREALVAAINDETAGAWTGVTV